MRQMEAVQCVVVFGLVNHEHNILADLLECGVLADLVGADLALFAPKLEVEHLGLLVWIVPDPFDPGPHIGQHRLWGPGPGWRGVRVGGVRSIRLTSGPWAWISFGGEVSLSLSK